MAEIIDFIFDEAPQTERWVNVFKLKDENFEVSSNVYSSKDEALKMAERFLNALNSPIQYVGTFKLTEI